MFSLFKKNNNQSTIDDVSRCKYYLDKELLLKGIIFDENRLKEIYKEQAETLPKECLINRTNSPYIELVTELQKTYDKKDVHRDDHNFDKKKIENIIATFNTVFKTKDLNEVFVDNLSINLNIEDIKKYRIILKEELVGVNKNLGLYKSSWGYLETLSRKLKELESNIEFLKKNKIYLDSKTFIIRLIVEFDFFESGSIDVNNQYFKVEIINEPNQLNVELNSKDCLRLLQLRNWGFKVKEEIKDYLEIRESGVDLGKLNHQLFKNPEDELGIDISNLDVN